MSVWEVDGGPSFGLTHQYEEIEEQTCNSPRILVKIPVPRFPSGKPTSLCEQKLVLVDLCKGMYQPLLTPAWGNDPI